MAFVNMAQTNTNLWVAVGFSPTQNNRIKYSYDGSNWFNSAGTAFSGGWGRDVAWNGRLWVAVGYDGGATGTIRYSSDGIIWTAATGFTSQGYGVAWNGRIWVAVGNDGTKANRIKYSSDGITWNNSSSGGFSTIAYGVAWNGRLWVAVVADSVTANTIQYSTDGINWTSSSSGGFTVTGGFGVAWNGRLWVAVGNGGSAAASIQYSTDGINWFNSSSGGFSTQGNSVAWNGRMWVAVGAGGSTLGSIQYSFDGIIWNNNLTGGFTSTTYGSGISWNGSLWVAVGQGSVIAETQYSSDGINWTSSSSGGFELAGSTYIGTGVAYSSNVIPSYNQTNFEIEPQNIPIFLRSTNTMSFLASTIIANNTLFVDTTNRVGINTGTPQTDLDVYGIGRFLTVSTFAVNASSITAPIISSFAVNASSITGINLSTGSLYASSITNVNIPPSRTNLWVALGSGGGSIQYSADGISWTGASGSFASTAYSAGWNGRLWVAVGAGAGVASIKYSYDGITWANVSSGGFSSVGRGVAWNGRIWVAVGNRNTADTDTIQYSYDGFTWVSPSSGGFSTTGYGVAWNGYMWIAVGNGGGTAGSIKYSYDGIAWANILTGGFTSFGFAAAWNGRFWVAVGSSTPLASTIQYSYDGINWTNSSSGGFSSVGLGIAWNGSLWVAVGIGAGLASIKYSRDGFIWTNISSGGFAVQGFSVAWNGRIWIAVGDNNTSIGSIQYSTDGISWSSNSSGGFSTEGFGIAYSANLTPSYNQTNFEIEPQNIPVFIRSTNQMSFTLSSMILNNTLTVDTTNRVGINTGTPLYDLDVNGIGKFITVSSLLVNTSSLTSVFLSSFAVNASSITAPIISTFALNASSIGINTKNPTYTLDVTGTTRLQSTFIQVIPPFSQNPSATNDYLLADIGLLGGTAASAGEPYPFYGPHIRAVLPANAYQDAIRVDITTGRGANNNTQVPRISVLAGTAGGYVGINTSTPAYTLDVRGQSRSLYSTFLINGNYGLAIASGGTANTGSANQTSIQAYNFGAGTTANLHLQPTGGNLGVGITTGTAPNYTLDVNGLSRISSLIVGVPTTNPSTSAFLLTLTRDLAVKPFTTVWNTSSDKRIKENIVDADYDRCYDDVKSLQLRRFTWASTFFNDAGGYDKRVLGFIAQEVSSVVPKAVTVTEANGYSNFHYLNIDQLNMSLYGAVKRTILDKEYMESTIKGQRIHIETLQGTTTCILSTLEGLQGR